MNEQEAERLLLEKATRRKRQLAAVRHATYATLTVASPFIFSGLCWAAYRYIGPVNLSRAAEVLIFVVIGGFIVYGLVKWWISAYEFFSE